MEKEKFPWTPSEYRASVRSYFEMLFRELQNKKYVKAEYRRLLLENLNKKTEASAEFMYQNISAVLIEIGLPYIQGYKPKDRFAKGVKELVLEFLAENPDILNTTNGILEKALELPRVPTGLWDALVDAPVRTLHIAAPRTFKVVVTDFVKKELQNSKLGKLGEAWALEIERDRLMREKRPDLASRVRLIGEGKGDGSGYDIASFEYDEKPRFIEVKTTLYSAQRPFFISENERIFSELHQDSYFLYRIFDFQREPKFFQLKGYVGQHVNLDPTDYRAFF